MLRVQRGHFSVLMNARFGVCQIAAASFPDSSVWRANVDFTQETAVDLLGKP